MRWLAVLVALSGCGRIDFDPRFDGGPGGGGSGDGGGSGSGDGGGGGGDTPVTACTNAITLQPLTPIMIDTCSGMDLLDGCGPANTKEVVFAFTVPASGGYNFRARDAGTQNVSNSTGLVDPACGATTTCAGILSRSFSAGQVIYFAVEASSGGCATIEFENF